MVSKQDRLSYGVKAKSIVEQMTLDEKINLMSGKIGMLYMFGQMALGNGYNHIPYPAGGCERLGVPELRF